jgi:hypothetical protein
VKGGSGTPSCCTVELFGPDGLLETVEQVVLRIDQGAIKVKDGELPGLARYRCVGEGCGGHKVNVLQCDDGYINRRDEFLDLYRSKLFQGNP